MLPFAGADLSTREIKFCTILSGGGSFGPLHPHTTTALGASAEY